MIGRIASTFRRVMILPLAVGLLMLSDAQSIRSSPPIEPSEPVSSSSTAFINSGVSLPGVHLGGAVWGDFDNDRVPDVLVTGELSTTAKIARVYQQLGDHTFEPFADFPGVTNSAAAWGDFNNDGWLDLALTGEVSPTLRISRIYQNIHGTGFSDISAGLPGVSDGSVAWGDYDSDGWPDLLLAGDTGSGLITKIFHNNHDGTFTEAVTLPGIRHGMAVWGDCNNDGRPDIILTGESDSGPLTKVYRNDGNGVFTDVNAALPALKNSAAAWGDYDNDGNLDLLLTGTTADMKSIAKVFRNTGNCVFTEDTSANLTGSATWVTAAWGDYDNDGWPDILVSSDGFPTVYHNEHDGSFTLVGNAGLPSLVDGSAVWGDYNNDHNLDILLTGQNSTVGLLTGVYIYSLFNPDNPPAAPTGLSAMAHPSQVLLHWNAATDDNTPAAGLSYNLRVGTRPGLANILAPMSITSTGYRQVPALGNAYEALTVTLKGLPVGRYYWSVQAIDTAFVGSAFAGENSFFVPYERYLPTILKGAFFYYEGPWESEPNNTVDTANGPLRAGRDYFGYFDDARDFFSIYTSSPGDIHVDLLNVAPPGVQLQLFYQDTNNRVAYVPTAPYTVDYAGQPGWYYVFLFTPNFDTQHPYTLRVTYP